jgi:hypothetical protein
MYCKNTAIVPGIPIASGVSFFRNNISFASKNISLWPPKVLSHDSLKFLFRHLLFCDHKSATTYVSCIRIGYWMLVQLQPWHQSISTFFHYFDTNFRNTCRTTIALFAKSPVGWTTLFCVLQLKKIMAHDSKILFSSFFQFIMESFIKILPLYYHLFYQLHLPVFRLELLRQHQLDRWFLC